jgi:OOP family OmpA-OmpF porin
MKILLFGLLAFIGWAALSDYIYICKIRGLCNETMTIRVFEKLPAKDTIKVNPEVKRVVQYPENLVIYFDFDRSEFIPDTKTTRYFDESSAYLDQNPQAKLSITGHTDSVGSDQYNQALGLRRAESLKRYFETKNTAEVRILVYSRGENEPADANNTNSGRANNRRTVITINK